MKTTTSSQTVPIKIWFGSFAQKLKIKDCAVINHLKLSSWTKSTSRMFSWTGWDPRVAKGAGIWENFLGALSNPNPRCWFGAGHVQRFGGEIHLVQRDSRFAAVRGSCVCRNLQTYKVHVWKELWRSRFCGLRFPWRNCYSVFFFQFKTKFSKVFYLIGNTKCYLPTVLQTEIRTTHTDVRWIPCHMFLF